jgi:hypothetical protein
MNQQLYNQIADNFYEIVEELYNSKNAISEERINFNVEQLCNTFGIDTDILKDGLCVKHKNKRYIYEST